MKIKLLILSLFTSLTLLAQETLIQSKTPVQLSKVPSLWKQISENNKLKPDYQYLDELNFFLITYKSEEQLVNGILAEPKAAGSYPVVVFNRGGNKEVGKMAKIKTLYSVVFAAGKLASEGYVILASCYRENDEFGGSDIQDVISIAKSASEIEKADSSKIGLFGISRGGMMTYLALKESSLFTTAVVANGPTNLFTLIEERPEMETNVCALLIPEYTTNKKDELEKRSAIFWPNELNKESSLLILASTQDKSVNPKQAYEMTDKLKAISYDVTLKKFDTNHGFSGKRAELSSTLTDWFGEKL